MQQRNMPFHSIGWNLLKTTHN